MFQKSAISFKSFSHGVIQMRTDEAYRFSSMARRHNNDGYAPFNVMAPRKPKVAIQELAAPACSKQG
jgi:hypothetical protein